MLGALRVVEKLNLPRQFVCTKLPDFVSSVHLRCHNMAYMHSENPIKIRLHLVSQKVPSLPLYVSKARVYFQSEERVLQSGPATLSDPVRRPDQSLRETDGAEQ